MAKIEKGAFVDERDGITYKTVKIGNQTWMAENLNHRAEGSLVYYNDPKNAEKYGRLYTWDAAVKEAPPGWHLPSRSEYETLDEAVGGEKTAGKKLKAANGGREDGEYGFAALLSGLGFLDGIFVQAGRYGYWWSASEYNSGYAYYRDINYDRDDIYWGGNEKSRLLSVRCLKD